MSEKKTPLPWRNVAWIVGILAGIILLWTGGSSAAQVSDQTENDVSLAQTQAYVAELEEKIRDFCAQVEGVGAVNVTVSLESGYRRVYGRDSSSYLSVSALSGGSTVCLSEELPVIGGIAIVCDGGGNDEVRQRLIGLLRAAYGIGANKIYVAPAQN